MPSLGPMEMMVIFVVALLVLGPAKLPQAGRQAGRALAELRRWSNGVQSELRDALELDVEVHDPTPPTLAAPSERPAEPRPLSTLPDQQSFT